MGFFKLFFIAIILVIGAGYIYLNTQFKDDAAAYASAMTGTNVEITAVTINPFANAVSLRGLDIGNPKGYQAENAIEFGSLYSAINLASVFSDKIIVNQVKLDGAEIYYEVGARGDNIRTIFNNVKNFNSKSVSKNDKPSNKSLLIKDFHLTNSQVVLAANLFGFKEDKKLAIDDIHLTNLNSSNAKAVAKQVGEKLVRQVAEATVKERASGYIDKLSGGKGGKVLEGLKGLF